MKIGCFITARLKSSRLKQKILLDLNGKSVLDRVIERSKKIPGIDNVVLCTSINPQDSILYQNALKNKIQFFAGSEDDVLDRLLSAAIYYGYDAFISITADNPLFSIYYSQVTVDWYKQKHFDFIFTKGLPIGCASYFIDVKALQVASYMKKESYTEIWGPFVNRSDFFSIGELLISNSPFKEDIRLTCDYTEDYTLLRKLYSLFPPESVPSIQDVFDKLLQNKSYLEINSNRTQATLDENFLSEINKNFNKQIEKGKNFATSIGKTLTPSFDKLEVEL